MDMTSIAIGVAAGGLVVGTLVWLLRGQQIAALTATNDNLRATAFADTTARAELENAKGRLELLKRDSDQLTEARKQNLELESRNSALRTELAKSSEAHKDQIDQLTRVRQEVQDQFKILAGDVLRTTNADFAKRAEDIFKTQKDLTSAEIDKRSKDISDLIKPLGDSLKAYETALSEIERARIKGYSGIEAALSVLSSQNNEVKTVTANLVSALRQSPKTRGRWGEETLRRVMEMSGMVERCDFDTEKSFKSDDETLRPDVLINVSDGRTIVVDAKAPVSAYLDAVNADSDEKRNSLLQEHAAQLRERLNNLSSKSYWEKIPGSTDCVVMFVPGDNFVSAAFERDPDLFEDGLRSRVLICTPTTFIALAKALAYGWRQEKLAANALEVQKLGQVLYSRLSTMVDHVSTMGQNLMRSVRAYNDFVGSLESRVLPQARRFHELGVEGTATGVKDLPPIDHVTRSLEIELSELPLLAEEKAEAET
jgi:DNA recombination protein RmuC